MNLVFQPEAGELHADQVGNWSNEDASFCSYRCGSWNGLQVFWANLFAHKNQMDTATSIWILGHQKHVYPGRMTVYEAVRVDYRPNSIQPVAVPRSSPGLAGTNAVPDSDSVIVVPLAIK